MTDLNSKDAIQLLLDTGRAQAGIQVNAEGDPFVMSPNGAIIPLKQYFSPRRIEQRVSLQDAGSFIDYVNRFKTPATLIFATLTETNATLAAVFDYHMAATDKHQPDHCAHRAVFTTLETPDWKAWSAADRRQMDQVQFATWLEDNSQLIRQHEKFPEAPSAADILELVRSLHGHSNARFNTALRLDNGAHSVSYDEDVVVKGNNTTRSEGMELPPIICGGVAVYHGAEPYLVPARLKVRVNERKLTLWFETINKPGIIRESIMAITKQVAEKTGIVPLLGGI